MENFSSKLIEKAYKQNNIEFPYEKFFSTLKLQKEEEDNEKLKKKKEKENRRETEFVYPEQESNVFYEKFIKEKIKEYGNWYDDFEDGDGLPDEGVDRIEYFKIGNEIYEVDLHCEAEWVGDWSVRKNLPGEVSATSIKKITDFEILQEYDGYVLFKIK